MTQFLVKEGSSINFIRNGDALSLRNTNVHFLLTQEAVNGLPLHQNTLANTQEMSQDV